MADVLEAEQESLDSPTFWKGFELTVLSLEDFMHFVAGPFVINLLICEDRLITEAEAEVIRLESVEYGKTVHPINDSIEDIVMMIGALQHVSGLELFSSIIDFLISNIAAEPY